MGYTLLQSQSAHPLIFHMVLSSDHTSPATGLVPVVVLSKDGAAFGSPAGAVTEIGNGDYKVAGNATDSNTLGSLRLYASVASADPTSESFLVVGYNPFDATRIGLAALPNATYNALGGLAADVIEGGTAQSATASTIVLRSGAVATDKYYNGAAIQIVSGTGAGQGPRTIVGYVGSSKTLTIHGAWVTTPDNTSVYIILNGPIPVIDTSAGLLQAAGSTTATLASTESATDNIFAGNLLKIVAGTGSGQARVIKSYVGSTKVATIDTAWITTPDTTSVYRTGLTELPALDSSLRPAVDLSTVSTLAAQATMQTAVTEIAVDTDTLLTAQALQATATALSTAQTAITEIAGDTDTLLTNLAAVPAAVTAALLAIYTQSGSSTLSGNVATFTSPDTLHTGTLTASPSWAAPTSIVWAQLT